MFIKNITLDTDYSKEGRSLRHYQGIFKHHVGIRTCLPAGRAPSHSSIFVLYFLVTITVLMYPSSSYHVVARDTFLQTGVIHRGWRESC